MPIAAGRIAFFQHVDAYGRDLHGSIGGESGFIGAIQDRYGRALAAQIFIGEKILHEAGKRAIVSVNRHKEVGAVKAYFVSKNSFGRGIKDALGDSPSFGPARDEQQVVELASGDIGFNVFFKRINYSRNLAR